MSHFASFLLNWYDEHARQLPWRVSPADRQSGVRPDPYRVWLSEIMLQQTTIAHGIRYFLRFTELWPNVEALAAADRDDIMREWAGLGYYARARNLHACAQLVSEAGGFPQTAAALQKLPGIGPYTAGAIASIAFDEPTPAVDGNVERVVTRYRMIETPLPKAKPDIREFVSGEIPSDRPGDFTQALMDLGAMICTPRSPDCPSCPLSKDCAAYAKGETARFPVKAKKAAKPHRYGQVFLEHDGERLRLERRPERGLLAGMLGLPTTDWSETLPSGLPESYIGGDIKRIGEVSHVFTHFSLSLEVYEVRVSDLNEASESVLLSDAQAAGLPSVFAKALKALR